MTDHIPLKFFRFAVQHARRKGLRFSDDTPCTIRVRWSFTGHRRIAYLDY